MQNLKKWLQLWYHEGTFTGYVYGSSGPAYTAKFKMADSEITKLGEWKGQCIIPASQRPDGTWRKTRRVKEGYVPQDEVPLYESKAKIIAKNKPDYPVGLAPDDVAKLKQAREKKKQENDIPGLNLTPKANKAQKKKAKSAAKKKITAQPEFEITSIFEEVKSHTKEVKDSSGADCATSLDPTKRLRNLKKKLKDTEKLEEHIKSGEIKKPEKEQLNKVRGKPDLIEEIDQLEKQLKELN